MNNLAAWIRTSQGLGRDGLIEWMAKKKKIICQNATIMH